MRRRIVIAGAGPAGAAVAARLVQHGRAHEVLVLERYQFPRDKPCGGGLTGHADEVMAELDLELDVPHIPARDARVRYGSFERDVRLGKPVNVIRREDYDTSLARQVEAKGVEIVYGEAVVGFTDIGDAIEVETSKGRTISCEVLVGADGAASVIRKQLAPKGNAIPHRLFKLEMTLEAGQSWPDCMLYDFSLMAKGLRGYSWVFPVPGNLVNVGLMHYPAPDRRLGGKQLTELLRQGLADVGIEMAEQGARGWPVWGYHPSTRVSAPRVLTVGDAAGIDGLTGEGIAVAMEQAVIAGDHIERGLVVDNLGFQDYRRALRKAVVGRELELDRRLAKMLYGGPNWRDWLSLVLFDPDMLQVYASRVDGSEVLADQWGRLFKALARHMLKRRGRRRQLQQIAV
ncbi:MAG: NAD(P)/FAD-dependent oxidoreductase [Deltaproteobacteria bacterium]|nr:NAD(P)/FAD-dependent oxidoreductase [Deltaproteobacteria bacterium]